jgi:hypothetical protein
MNLLKEKEKLIKLRKDLIDFRKKEVFSKLTEQGENATEDLRYAFEYIDEAIKSLANVNMCIYHADVFLKNNLNGNKEEGK